MFHRTDNDDGTTDSICLECFLNIRSRLGETNIDAGERGHICLEAISREVSGARRLNVRLVRESPE